MCYTIREYDKEERARSGGRSCAGSVQRKFARPKRGSLIGIECS